MIYVKVKVYCHYFYIMGTLGIQMAPNCYNLYTLNFPLEIVILETLILV